MCITENRALHCGPTVYSIVLLFLSNYFIALFLFQIFIMATTQFFKIGEKFDSLLALETRIRRMNEQTKFTLSITRGKPLKAVYEKKKKSVMYNVTLYYNEVIYHCPLGGPLKTKGKGQRSKVSLKTNCPAMLNLSITSDKQQLKVLSFIGEHNHVPVAGAKQRFKSVKISDSSTRSQRSLKVNTNFKAPSSNIGDDIDVLIDTIKNKICASSSGQSEKNIRKFKEFVSTLDTSNESLDEFSFMNPRQRSQILELPLIEEGAGASKEDGAYEKCDTSYDLSLSSCDELLKLAMQPNNDDEIKTLNKINMEEGKMVDSASSYFTPEKIESMTPINELEQSIASMNLSISDQDNSIIVGKFEINVSGNEQNLLRTNLTFDSCSENSMPSGNQKSSDVALSSPTSPHYDQKVEKFSKNSKSDMVQISVLGMQPAIGDDLLCNPPDMLPTTANLASSDKAHSVSIHIQSADRMPEEQDTWCICKGPSDDRAMIGCDCCDEWYHYNCIGLTLKQVKRMGTTSKKWICPSCRNQ